MTQNEPEHRNSWTVIAGMGFLLPVLYLLASGPTYWVALRMTNANWPGGNPTALEIWLACYRPVYWLIDGSPTFYNCFRWYLLLV